MMESLIKKLDKEYKVEIFNERVFASLELLLLEIVKY